MNKEEITGITLEGWTALTETISGDDLVWKVEDGKEYMPDVYETELEVQKEIARDILIQIEQFLADEREYDEVDWEPQNYPVRIRVYEDGTIVCYEVGYTMPAKEHREERLHEVLRTTLSDWRKQL